MSPLQVVAPHTALRLRAVRDFENKSAGAEFLFKGPATYMPRVEVQVVEIVRAIIIRPNEALRLRARRECESSDGVTRTAGEEWLVREEGAYLPDVHEEVRETVKAYILTDKKALQLEAVSSFTDELGVKRNAGERWLVTLDDKESHIPDVNERVIGEIPITTLNSRQVFVSSSFCFLHLSSVRRRCQPRQERNPPTWKARASCWRNLLLPSSR